MGRMTMFLQGEVVKDEIVSDEECANRLNIGMINYSPTIFIRDPGIETDDVLIIHDDATFAYFKAHKVKDCLCLSRYREHIPKYVQEFLNMKEGCAN